MEKSAGSSSWGHKCQPFESYSTSQCTAVRHLYEEVVPVCTWQNHPVELDFTHKVCLKVPGSFAHLCSNPIHSASRSCRWGHSCSPPTSCGSPPYTEAHSRCALFASSGPPRHRIEWFISGEIKKLNKGRPAHLVGHVPHIGAWALCCMLSTLSAYHFTFCCQYWIEQNYQKLKPKNQNQLFSVKYT